jgi:hypothetical protein
MSVSVTLDSASGGGRRKHCNVAHVTERNEMAVQIALGLLQDYRTMCSCEGGEAIDVGPGDLLALAEKVRNADAVVSKFASAGWKITMDCRGLDFSHPDVVGLSQVKERLSSLGIDPDELFICGDRRNPEGDGPSPDFETE